MTMNTLQISTIFENCARMQLILTTPFYTTCKWASYLLSEAKPWALVKSVSAMTLQFSIIKIYSRFRVDLFTSNMLANDSSAKHALGVNSSLSRSVSLFVTS
jgi:hypothetical protein